MSDFKIIITSVIPEVTSVRFYDETVLHVKEEHPEVPIELPSIEGAVNTTLTAPTQIERSHSNSYVFVHDGMTNKSGDPLRVPVKMIDGTTSGRIRTVYFASKETPVQSIVWRRDNE